VSDTKIFRNLRTDSQQSWTTRTRRFVTTLRLCKEARTASKLLDNFVHAVRTVRSLRGAEFEGKARKGEGEFGVGCLDVHTVYLTASNFKFVVKDPEYLRMHYRILTLCEASSESRRTFSKTTMDSDQ
jgi:hypothetical protein